MLYATIAEYDENISITQVAIQRTIAAGSSRAVGSSHSNRSTTENSLNELRDHLTLLQNEKLALQQQLSSGYGPSAGGFMVGAGW